MFLEEFFDYKNRVMEDLLTDPEVLRLLSDDFNPAAEPASLMYLSLIHI